MRRLVALGAILACSALASGDAMSTRTLAAEARYVANHGGVTGSCYGCATRRMKMLARRLVIRTFRPAGSVAVARALCIARREAGDSPGAISRTDDHGIAQINRPTHPQFDYYRMTHDPVYSVKAFWAVSSHGRDFSPWNGGAYPC